MRPLRGQQLGILQEDLGKKDTELAVGVFESDKYIVAPKPSPETIEISSGESVSSEESIQDHGQPGGFMNLYVSTRLLMTSLSFRLIQDIATARHC